MKNVMAKYLLVVVFFISVDSPTMATQTKTTTMPLSNFTKISPLHLSQAFDLLATPSPIRPRYLKQQEFAYFSSQTAIKMIENLPLIMLEFGTPQQTLSLVLDTGSSFTWLPCSSNSTKDPKLTQIFNPGLSLSSKILGCNHPKCRLFVERRAQYQCKNSNENNCQNCSYPILFNISNMEKYASGVLHLETLNIPGHVVEDFVVGCSKPSHKTYGSVGFGHDVTSFPSQLRIMNFAYCLPSNQYNGRSHSGYLILNGASYHGGLTYTPFHKNPSNPKLKGLYYVILREIIVGSKRIEIPHALLVPGSDGYGGTILDSSTPFTFMEKTIFLKVTEEFHNQLGNGNFLHRNEITMFCFDIERVSITLPKLALGFKGGVRMTLPPEKYIMVEDDGTRCLSIVTKTNPSMPSIILGNIQLREFHMEFDLAKHRLGFIKNKCN